MSGAGRIKQDGSDAESVYEVKDANKSFTLKGRDLLTSFKDAARHGKDAVWIITFKEAGVVFEGTVRRDG